MASHIERRMSNYFCVASPNLSSEARNSHLLVYIVESLAIYISL